MGRILKDISQFFHRGQPVSMMYHKGKLVYGGIKPWQAYVQDGLVFQLDCKEGLTINNDGSATWKDLVGGKTVVASSGVSIGEKGGVKIESEKSFDSLRLENLQHYTLEVVFFAKSNEVKNIVGSSFDSHYLVVYDEQNSVVVNKECDSSKIIDTIATVSLNEGYNIDRYAQNEQLTIGKSPSVGGFNGSIYVKGDVEIVSIRIYDLSIRSEHTYLTEQERTKNYAIDHKRFAAPPVPENALVDADGYYIIDADGNFIVDNN